MAAGNEQPRPSSESASRRLAPWAVSVTLHAALVIGAAFIVWQVVEGPEDPPASAISMSETVSDVWYDGKQLSSPLIGRTMSISGGHEWLSIIGTTRDGEKCHGSRTGKKK